MPIYDNLDVFQEPRVVPVKEVPELPAAPTLPVPIPYTAISPFTFDSKAVFDEVNNQLAFLADDVKTAIFATARTDGTFELGAAHRIDDHWKFGGTLGRVNGNWAGQVSIVATWK